MLKLSLKTEPLDYRPVKKRYDSPRQRTQDLSLLRWNQVTQIPRGDIQRVREHLRVTLEEQVDSLDHGMHRDRLEGIYKLTGYILDGLPYDKVREEYPYHRKLSDYLRRIITHRNLLCGE